MLARILANSGIGTGAFWSHGDGLTGYGGSRTAMNKRVEVGATTDVWERDPLLVLLDELVRTTDEPVLVPDLRFVAPYVLDAPRGRELYFAPSMIFHVLRDMVAEGLVTHTPAGYRPTERGVAQADVVRQHDPDFAERAAEAIRTYAIQ
jgi:hypothetical protein